MIIMPAEVSPKKFQNSVHCGLERFKNFRNARLMFLRNYTGPYYDHEKGAVGEEALNLIFNAIRILVPNIVMNFPKHEVESEFVANKQYGDLLAMALSHHDKRTQIDEIYRRVIVDSIFTLGILKTGLAESDSIYALDEYDHIDAGEIYTEAVDFDNFIVDPNSTEHMFRDAAYMGDKIRVPRQVLLDSGLYNNDLVERLPAIGSDYRNKDARDLSRRSIRTKDESYLQEEVEIAELWVRDADALITIPATKDVVFDEYLRADDFYGPDDGPYTLLSLTPPVPGNPLPVPMVGIWNDLHILANKMAKKIVDQASRQKDIITYRRSAADDVEEVRDAGDGEAVAVDNPDDIQTHSFGGQQQSNEVHLAALNSWFNMMAANPQGVGGQRFDADSATEAKILQQNASIGLEDMKDAVYKMAAKEARKRAWYLHTDPFIQMPLTRRRVEPARYQQSFNGPVIVQPAQMVEEQVFLTPEARSGNFLDFHFKIRPESMGRKDSQAQYLEALDFATKILPAAANAAQVFMMLGIPFSAQQFIVRMARDRGIDWMDEVFFDPNFQMQMAMLQLRSPQMEGTQGVPQTPQMPRGVAQFMQNGQPGTVMSGSVTPETQERQGQQAGANEMQRVLKEMGV